MGLVLNFKQMNKKFVKVGANELIKKFSVNWNAPT
jgi:hypothetical protein